MFLAILLFNWFGYRLLSSYLEDRANTQLEAILDNNDYEESQLTSIKIPVSYLPYYNNSKSFERVNGRVEIQGIEYKYVKRRIYNDSLELLCIPNHAVMKLKAAKDEFFLFLNDLQRSGADKSPNSHHSSSKTFSVDHYTIISPFRLNDFYVTISPAPFHYFIRNSSRHRLTVEQPPEIA